MSRFPPAGKPVLCKRTDAYIFVIPHTEQYRAAFAVKEGAKRFHAALQLSGGFLELHPSAFFFGYQPFYYVEVVYAHIQFCNVGTKIVLFAGFRANR